MDRTDGPAASGVAGAVGVPGASGAAAAPGGAGRAYAAVDLGASSGRVMLGFIDRSHGSPRIRMTEVHRFANGPRPDSLAPGATLEWDVDRLFDETLTGLAAAVDAAAAAGCVLAGIGVDSWGVDYALDDVAAEGGGAVSIPSVAHHRGADPAWVAEAAAVVRDERVYAVTGIPPHPINTSARLRAAVTSPGGTAASARPAHTASPAGPAAMSGAEPDGHTRAGTLLLVPDLWVRLLTGTIGAERTIASTTQLLDARTGTWSRELIDAWGLGAVDFPEVTPSGTPAGVTLPWVTARLGAARPVPVHRVAGHDTASALAFAAPGDGQLLVSSGSWSLAGISVAAPVLSTEALAAGLTNERGVGDSTLLLRNLAGLWLLTECARQWSNESGRMLDPLDLVREASLLPDSGVPVFDVGDPRLLAPGGMPERIAALCVERGHPAPKGVLGTVRSIVESLAAAYAESVGLLERVTGERLRSVRIVGGGSRNELLCRRTAALTGLPVVAGPAEASAFGNLAVQLVAAGEFATLAEVYASGGMDATGPAVAAATDGIVRYEPGGVTGGADSRGVGDGIAQDQSGEVVTR
ncbi:FGGY-family carbohydrate kinase [Herbiconiux sp. CPCC 205716]|uniref:FGGY-family carbohydrate kinase n=1 Tax=Herbiconiux gentiana TaxID=2970912 RepID=A0ABT2GBM5_9MICO|nr:FGGY-family carbohydrate kinase [Herbiconiux gentiana]MCS5713617.1 FGGY-family carbohydrate kinase [Herbiconiux gentiana]